MHADHLILGDSVTAIEVRSPKDTLDVYFQTKLFKCFPSHRLQKALPWLESTGDTFPLPGSEVLYFRTSKQQVLAIRLAPDQCTNHCQKAAYSHQSSPMFQY